MKNAENKPEIFNVTTKNTEDIKTEKTFLIIWKCSAPYDTHTQEFTYRFLKMARLSQPNTPICATGCI